MLWVLRVLGLAWNARCACLMLAAHAALLLCVILHGLVTPMVRARHCCKRACDLARCCDLVVDGCTVLTACWLCCVGKRVVSISAGKTRTAYVTEEGDIYVWETRAPKAADERSAPAGPAAARADAQAAVRAAPVRVEGVKRACQVGYLHEGVCAGRRPVVCCMCMCCTIAT